MHNKPWGKDELAHVRILVNILTNTRIADHLNTVFWKGQPIRSASGVKYICSIELITPKTPGYITYDQCGFLLVLPQQIILSCLDSACPPYPFRSRFPAPCKKRKINVNQYHALASRFPTLPKGYIMEDKAAQELHWSVQSFREACRQQSIPHIVRDSQYAVSKDLIRKARMLLLKGAKHIPWSELAA